MASYPTHGLHLRHRHPNRWLLLTVAVAAIVGAGAWALVDHYTGGTTGATTESPTLASRGIANQYIAALNRLDASALDPILNKNVVEVDWAYGDSGPFLGAAEMKAEWTDMFRISGKTGWRGSVCCVAPSWAAVTYRWWGSTNPLTHKPFNMSGLSILEIKNGKIVRETLYWDVPGRSPGVAATTGRKFATTLAAHQPGWAATLKSLYSKDAIERDAGAVPSTRNVNNLIWGRWAMPSFTPLHASLNSAGPILRMESGTTRLSWAVVDWVAQDASPNGGKVSGVSILQFRNDKIIRETMYHSSSP